MIADPAGSSERSPRAYIAQTPLDSSIDAIVQRRWASGDALDDVIGDIAALVRRMAPLHVAPSDSAWEPEWRAHYEMCDGAVARAIRAYVAHGARPVG